MSRKVCNIACEDKCLIADEETTELATEYKNYKTSVRGIISRFDSYS